MGDYDEEVAKMPRRKPSPKEAQQWRYGSKLDENRHAARQIVFRYLGGIGGAITVAAALSQLVKAWWHG